MQLILYFITLGLYAIYWVYSTADEMVKATGSSANAGLITILSIIPFINLIALWMHSELVEKATNGELNKVLMFLIGLIFSPAYWIVVQSSLNKRAGAA